MSSKYRISTCMLDPLDMSKDNLDQALMKFDLSALPDETLFRLLQTSMSIHGRIMDCRDLNDA